MSPEEATTTVIDALNVWQIPYMLVGSLSSIYYGTARVASNADFVVTFETASLPLLMSQFGPRFRISPQTIVESATTTRRFLVNLADKSYLVELLLSEDAHDVERFSRRRKVRFLNRDVFLPTVEDAIIIKLRWFRAGQRQRDFQDARGMIAVQGDRIDWDYVYS